MLEPAHCGPTADPVHAGAQRFKEAVEQGSGGAIRIDVFPAEQLGAGGRQLLDRLRLEGPQGPRVPGDRLSNPTNSRRPISETCLALQTGTVDGQENPVVHIAKLKFQEVRKHLSLTRHAFTAAPMTMNLAEFDGLSKTHRDLPMRAAAAGAKVGRRMSHGEEAASLETIREAGVQIVENVDTAPFRAAACDKVRAMYVSRFGAELVDRIDAAAK